MAILILIWASLMEIFDVNNSCYMISDECDIIGKGGIGLLNVLKSIRTVKKCNR